MDELDLFFAEGCIGGVVLEFLLEFVAEDEVALAFVQVGGNEVFGTELKKDIVKFGRGGFGEDGKSGWMWWLGKLWLRRVRMKRIPVFLWAEDEAVKERVWVLRRRALTAER